MSRSDKRKSTEIRSISIEQNYVNRDGSASFKFGDSNVVCSINGPVEVKVRDEKLDKATIDVSFRPLIGTKDKTNEFFLRSTLENVIQANLHPRTLIQIVCQVLMDDGSILAAAINATTLALINAGIPMTDIVVAVACAIDENGVILVDPKGQEIEKSQSFHTFAFNKASLNLLCCESLGLFTEQQYFDCYELSKNAARDIIEEIHKAIQFSRLNPRKISWTQVYRRMHKKGITEEVAKKRSRRTVKIERAIVGASWEAIKSKRNQKPEVRAAARAAAVREGKEKKKQEQAKRKAEKAKIAQATFRGQTKVSKHQARGAQVKVAAKSR
ncbi:12119_t:CDS:2 [Acaulospora colombiana]|uniref:12119_t:CDS:1 n=1 Tax=Acaulospora colombiana TaxID=27376 RepID=A0ACA9JWU6_9GLOM|nr:12119_t:CDS:2 [Acaulospora colombiana]